jgi:hypothetical protein
MRRRTYMEWAGTVTQQVVVPWAVIENSDDALQSSLTRTLIIVSSSP